MADWRREFPDKYYKEDKMGSAGNYILDELIKQINLLRKENERLTKENKEIVGLAFDGNNVNVIIKAND